MKRVALVLNTLNYGGVAKSFIELVKLLKDSCHLDVVLFRNDGDLIDMLPSDVNVIIPKGLMGCFVEDRKSCKKLGKRKYFFKFVMDGICKFTHNRSPFVRYALRHSQILTGYDVAISYAKVCPNNDCWKGCAEYVLNNIKAERKYVVNHDNFMQENFGESQIEIIKKFDKMFFVSQSCMKHGIENISQLANKFDYMYNPLNINEIRVKAQEEVQEFDKNKINLISVGRLTGKKNYLGLVDIIHKVKPLAKRQFVLNIVGGGSEQMSIENKIKELNLDNEVKLWGFQNNPYKYISKSDVFVLNSVCESFGIVYIEAMSLGVPVVTTCTDPAHEIIGDNGIIVNNDEKMIDTLLNLINNSEAINKLKEKVKNYQFDNETIKNKWLSYINGEING